MESLGLRLGIDAGRSEAPNSLDRAPPMRGLQQRRDIDAVLVSPAPPQAAEEFRRIDERAVHVEEDGLGGHGGPCWDAHRRTLIAVSGPRPYQIFPCGRRAYPPILFPAAPRPACCNFAELREDRTGWRSGLASFNQSRTRNDYNNPFRFS